MDLDGALAALGVAPGADPAELRSTYRRLLRDAHPDLGDGSDLRRRTERTATLTAAWAVVEQALATGALPRRAVDDAVVDGEGGDAGRHPPAGAAESRAGADDPSRADPGADVDVDVDLGHGDAGHGRGGDRDGTLWVELPPDETFVVLHEAAGRVGQVAYVDRQLGLLEVIVRFEGGPTCSVLATLQGRATGTDVLCTMTSIEAAPTPAVGPVLDALADAVMAVAADLG